MTELTLEQARSLLTEYAAVVRSRNDRIRAAVAAGVRKSEAARLLEIHRSTVYAVLDAPREPVPAAEAALDQLRAKLAGHACTDPVTGQ